MIIACPRCAASYTVDDTLFGVVARVVRCSACAWQWTQPAELPPGSDDDGELLGPGSEVDAGDSLPEAAEPKDVEADDSPASPQPVPAVAVVETASPPPEESTETAVPGEAPSAELDQAAAVAPESEPEIATPPPATARKPAARGKPVQPRLQLPRGRLFVAGVAAAATAIALASLLLVLRGPIMTLLPASTGFYDLLGLAPDPLGAGLEIREIASVRERQGGEDVLTVTGVVANTIQRPAPLPPIRVSLFDAADEELQFVTLPSERPTLEPGETLRFDAKINQPRPEARRVRVGFVPPPPS